ncbi:MAG: type II toxin-antitoxin system RelE/ParE family toxin [Nanoarchaeota archaeon]|nr:type II toxin-antitoxin system RelE/ParE family toxin [Nanoarchaeota archaeon]MBU1269946.1 type II toxin-antitoxin system RelE/ParE family toxin [Nanoarchaeota archaeon]MBU1604037.1 type II toxin-antitoxin system RelE/ParE family toxin [Nanoarchaeota archaeon]MBU2442476.1 type II toxin-antitoxin system RelE/ParE family toxin [Nanoarchaeota archaeon]
MLIEYKKDFLKTISKIKDNAFKDRIKKQVEKIIENPEIGKPMRYERKNTRELYVMHYRLAYSYDSSEDKITFLELYHKEEQ